MNRRLDRVSLVAGLAVCGLGVLVLLDQTRVLDLPLGYGAPAAARLRGSDPARRRAGGAAAVSGNISAVDAPPLRRDTEHGIVAGVCAGLSTRLGIDPIILRVGFGAASLVGGSGLVLYVIAWAVVPEEGERGTLMARVAGRRETWFAVSGIVLLLLSVLLLFREWGIWFSDAIVWPVLIVGRGGGADLAPERGHRAVGRPGAARALAPGPPAGPVPRAAPADAGARPGHGRRRARGGAAGWCSCGSTTRSRRRGTCCSPSSS